MSYKGRFRPKHPSKYRGDHTKITYRSLWELRYMKFCDNNSAVLEWASEEIIIPYKSPVDKKVHRYFPDFWVTMKKADGTIATYLIEVKPDKQTRPPVPGKRKSRRFLNECLTWSVNEAKWNAAIAYCRHMGWEFKILTEKTLGV